MSSLPPDAPEPTEADYARATQRALERGDTHLALEQIAGALSFRPQAPELLALLDVALSRSRDPLALLPHEGSTFFGVGAVRAAALARTGQLSRAIVQLLDVVTFRPTAPYLPWIDGWRARGLRGVAVDVVAAAVARFHAAIDREGRVAPENLFATIGLLEELRKERPKASADLLRLEVISCRLAGDLDRAEALVDQALDARPSATLLFERGENLRWRGDVAGAEALLRRASEMAPNDLELTLDLAEARIRAGLLDDAIASYGALRSSPHRETAEIALRGISALRTPSDDALRAEVLAGSRLPLELEVALRIGRTLLPPWNDPLAESLDAMLEDLRARRPAGVVRLRVELDRPIPTSAQVLFATAAKDFGVTATLGETSESTVEAPPEPPDGPTVEQVEALLSQPLDLDAWARWDGRLALDPARRAFTYPLRSTRSVDAFERQRLAVLALALREIRTADAPALRWVVERSVQGDAWEARAALLSLGAVARREVGLREAALAAAAIARALDDGRVEAVHALALHLDDPNGDASRAEALVHLSRSVSRPGGR